MEHRFAGKSRLASPTSTRGLDEIAAKYERQFAAPMLRWSQHRRYPTGVTSPWSDVRAAGAEWNFGLRGPPRPGSGIAGPR